MGSLRAIFKLFLSILKGRHAVPRIPWCNDTEPVRY